MMLEKISSNYCFDGEQLRFRHDSEVLSCSMNFSIYLPKAAVRAIEEGLRTSFPTLYWLSGLTCTDENFVQKAGAQSIASELGLILIIPDTSPRGEEVPDDKAAAYDFGLGAGFYLNATEAPFNKHYQMYDYICHELPSIVEANFPINRDAQSIFGHSMGGHGALTIALKNAERFKSVSAFSPICATTNCPWGEKALSLYLGDNRKSWLEYDAAHLIRHSKNHIPMLIDQGSADDFLKDQLKPELLLAACQEAGYPVQYNLRPGYDHSFFFIASYIESHIRFHHEILTGSKIV
ncbi:MAG: S-formylglutathione hydrolase [Pseudomonadales bacterium]|nr:S-formylglutathione hydrolase [Pseudomonadales bacterium]